MTKANSRDELLNIVMLSQEELLDKLKLLIKASDKQLLEPKQSSEFTTTILKSIKFAPLSITTSAIAQLKKLLPKNFFSLLRNIAGFKKKSHIAKSFNNNSLQRAGRSSKHTITQYIAELFSSEVPLESNPTAVRQEVLPPFTQEEVENALTYTGNKATGLDALAIKHLKNRTTRANLTAKLSIEFTNWANNSSIPEYIKRARVIPLSKDDTDTPDYGQIRTIAILPALSKVFEKVVLKRLQKNLSESNSLSKTQRGFTQGASTMNNIYDLATLLTKAKARIAQDR